MGEFAFNVKNNVRQGYQRHHLIPVEVVSRTIIAPLISPLKNVGFDPHHFATNGLWLPASEEIALRTGLPLHRGPHPHYNEFVGDQTAFLYRNLAITSHEGSVSLKIRLNHLQVSLHRALSRTDTDMWLNRYDPREELAKFATFDDDLRQLSMADLLA